MKVKKYVIFILVIANLFIFSNNVEAVFTIEDAEKIIGAKEFYFEVYSSFDETELLSPRKKETDSWETNDSKVSSKTEFTITKDVPKNITLHGFFQSMGMAKNDVNITYTGEGLEIIKNKTNIDNNGWDGIEWFVDIQMSKIINNTDNLDNQLEVLISWDDKLVRLIIKFTSCNELINERIANEIKKEKEKENEATKDKDDMINAWKTIPGYNADEIEIDTFIKSDAKYNELRNLKKVSIDTAKKWRDTVNVARVDIVSRNKYTETVSTLDDYIKGLDVDKHKEPLEKLISSAIQGTQNTIDNIHEKIEVLYASLDGESRTEGKEFVDVLDDMNHYNPEEFKDGDTNKFTDKISLILSVITNIGMVVSVIMPAVLGIKYMLASVEGRAEYKKDIVPYIVGAFVLFGICTIVKILQAFGNSINNIFN